MRTEERGAHCIGRGTRYIGTASAALDLATATMDEPEHIKRIRCLPLRTPAESRRPVWERRNG